MSAGALEIELILKADRAATEIAATRQRIDGLQKQIDEFNTTGARLGRLKEAFGDIATAVGGVAVAVVGATEALARAAAAGEDHERALARLGSAWDLVRQATNDTVSAEQALHVQQTLTQAGIRITGDQLAVITRRAREYAMATGGDVNQALDQMTDTLRGLESEGLRRFGLSVDQNRSRTENFRSVIDQMRDSFHGAGPAARTMNEELDRTHRTFGELAGRIGESIANLIHLREAMGGLADFVSGEWSRRMAALERNTADSAAHTAALRSVGSAEDLAFREGFTYHGRDVTDFTTSQLNALREATQRASRLGGAQGQALIDAALGAADTARAQAIVDGITQAAGTATQDASAAFEQQIRDRNALAANDNSKGSRSHSGTHNRPDYIFDGTSADVGQFVGGSFGVGGLESVVARDTAVFAEQDRLQAAADQAAEATRARNEHLIESARHLADEVVAAQHRMAEAERQRNSLSEQLTLRFAQHAELHETRAQGMAGLIEGAYNTMTGALKQHIAAVAQGKESIGEALKATVEEVLLNLAVESTVKALFETAQGIAAAATGAAPVAAGHFASAGMYAAVAAAGFGGYAAVGALGGSSAPASAVGFGGSPGAAASTRGAGNSAANDNGSVTNNYYVSGFAMTHEGVQDAVIGAAEGGLARGRRIRGLLHAA